MFIRVTDILAIDFEKRVSMFTEEVAHYCLVYFRHRETPFEFIFDGSDSTKKNITTDAFLLGLVYIDTNKYAIQDDKLSDNGMKKTETFIDLLDMVKPNDYEDNPPLKWVIEKMQSHHMCDDRGRCSDEDGYYLFTVLKLSETNSAFYFSHYNIYEKLEDIFSLNRDETIEVDEVDQLIITLLTDVLKIDKFTFSDCVMAV
jgi:hypothetical protein